MNKLPINGDLVGLSIDPISHSWTNRDAMLYALGVGCRPPEDLDFIYEGRGPKVVPTFAVIPGLRAMGSAMQRIDINLAALLHGEQSVTTHRPLPAAAEVTVDQVPTVRSISRRCLPSAARSAETTRPRTPWAAFG